MNINLDSLDNAILKAFQTDSSISNVRLAEQIGLSPAATLARVKKLEQEGIIHGYRADINRKAIGYGLLCIVLISLKSHDFKIVNDFRTAMREMPEVIECHFVTGNSDYMIKVAVNDPQELERFLVRKLTPLPGVDRLQTSLVLSEIKTHTILPIYSENNS